MEQTDWRDKYIRLQAEFDNFRKRTLREKMALIESGGSDIIKAMLPVLDDMQRAIAASEKSDDIDALREGERLVIAAKDATLNTAQPTFTGSFPEGTCRPVTAWISCFSEP